ncbi:MAG: DUF3465 domain-containing protein [Wenzhouxiangellaceae bacterium]
MKLKRSGWIVLLLVAVVWLAQGEWPGTRPLADGAPTRGAIEQAFAERRGDLQVRDSGVVTRVLPPDNDGRPHQRFILELDSGHTVLVAHNLTLSRPVHGLKRGDRVEFYGEYEWNERGGVVHWTHHDPNGRHLDGWLQHKGIKYQ